MKIKRVMKPYKGTPRHPLDDVALAQFFEHCHRRGASVLATPKIDGIRCIKLGGCALTGQLRPLPNLATRKWIEANCPDGWDGELVVPGTFQVQVSAFMSQTGTPDFTWKVFDNVQDVPWDYRERMRIPQGPPSLVEYVLPFTIDSVESFPEYETATLAAGYEGVCLRPSDSPYKQGRPTWRESYLIAVKRFVDEEATVTGFEPMYTNKNPLYRDEQGLHTRSSSAAGLERTERLGALRVTHPRYGQFFIGTGFTTDQRERFWAFRDQLMGAAVTFKHQVAGVKGKPRLPVFKAFRSHYLE